MREIKEIAENEIKRRSNNAIELAKRFPDLRGLSFEKMLMKLPMDLDFITASELFEELNREKG